MKKGKIIGAAIGNCIHVVNLMKFLSRAENKGYDCTLLGGGMSVHDLISTIIAENPDYVVVSYRLTPEVGEKIFIELKESVIKNGLCSTPFILGGTPPVLEVGLKTNMFVFGFADADSSLEIESFLFPDNQQKPEQYAQLQKLHERIEASYPTPLLRHHFGLPSLEETIKGAKIIAESGVLDILSIGPDQNCQESFFRQNEIDETFCGAGGVPIGTEEDLKKIYNATRCGNYPLVRSYAGTRDLIKWGELLKETINIAWGAVPLTMYSELDGRSERPLAEAIKENQAAMRWYAKEDIPLEVNESHQWGLRFTSDIIEVATAYIATYNAKQMGVQQYVMQYMFNTPPGISPEMDIAKMLAKQELTESLSDDTFTSYRMVRTGLASLSPESDIAKGQLAASMTHAMTLKPHIIHVVGYSEGDHAANPEEIIESCKIIKGVIKVCQAGIPDVSKIETILSRKAEIITEANILINEIQALGQTAEDPLTDPSVLARAIKIGLLDAPLLKGLECASGEIRTKIINGSSCTINPVTKEPMNEAKRIALITKETDEREKVNE